MIESGELPESSSIAKRDFQLPDRGRHHSSPTDIHMQEQVAELEPIQILKNGGLEPINGHS